MSRASRIVLIASLLLMSTTVTGVSLAGAAAGPTITQVAAATTHANCARMSDGTATCSGLNEKGQLGNGTGINQVTPTVVKNTAGTGSLLGVSQVVTGYQFACARLSSGQVDCWGDNTFGQLGDGVAGGLSGLPVTVKNATNTGPLTGVAQIAAGNYHACARLTNGQVDCWGYNGYYGLGDGTTIDHSEAKPVVNGAGHPSLTHVVNISVSQYDTCAVGSDGSARCWGINTYGMLGNGTTKPSAVPGGVKSVSGVGFLTHVKTIVTAPSHTCALLSTGGMDCWGLNQFGQLGDGTTQMRLRPVVVKNVPGTAALVNITQITAGGGSSGDHTCAVLKAKTALCWGGNFFGQLGDGTKTDRHHPAIVKSTSSSAALTGVLTLVAGAISTCATTSTGTKCWGFNSGGQFGNGNARNTTKPVPAKP